MQKIIIDKPEKYQILLNQPGQQLEVVGRFRLAGGQVSRWDIEIVHAAANTSSKTDIKGVVDGSAQAFVNGTIKVLPSAKTPKRFYRKEFC